MAARRLIIVMLVLLGMSTLAAALAPPPENGEESTTTSTTPKRERPEPAGGQLVEATIDAQAKGPQAVDVPLGDQLSLRVKSTRAGQITIPKLGLLENVTRLDPARFDILASSSGRFEVRMLGSKGAIGALRFERPERGKPDKAQ
jgi:hypothetical protein